MGADDEAGSGILRLVLLAKCASGLVAVPIFLSKSVQFYKTLEQLPELQQPPYPVDLLKAERIATIVVSLAAQASLLHR